MIKQIVYDYTIFINIKNFDVVRSIENNEYCKDDNH